MDAYESDAARGRGALKVLASLRGRGFVVALRQGDDYALPLRLVVTPGGGLTAADKAALKEHKEDLLDAIWVEPHPSDDRAIGWPHDSPQWDGTGFRWAPMTASPEDFTEESDGQEEGQG